jgi:hypothetical protein
MPVKAVQERQTFEDLVAAKRRYSRARISPHFFIIFGPITQFFREQASSMQSLVARPVTAPARQKTIPAAGIPTRGIPTHGIDSPKPKYCTYANQTESSSRKTTKTIPDASRAAAASSTPRSRSQTSQSSSELYALAHDFFASTASSEAKAVSNQELQVALSKHPPAQLL